MAKKTSPRRSKSRVIRFPLHGAIDRHPVIRKCMQFAIKKVPELAEVMHTYCRESDEAHVLHSRVYAHSFCDRLPRAGNVVCWAAAAFRELPPEHIAGICLHELGHQMVGSMEGAPEYDAEREADLAVLERLGVAIKYKKPKLIQWVSLKKLV